MNWLNVLLFLFATVSARKGFGPGEQEWGYSEVRKGAHMFWWLYYTTGAQDPTDKPLVLWLQGGPGASSTGFGNFEELGPLYPNLQPRNSTWVKYCNVMFVDNPVGTGWSYVDQSSLIPRDNKQIALDLVAMLSDFYKKFPKFKETALYITGESYGGKMIAEFALELNNAIKNNKIKSNLKGVGLGDSWISPIDSVMTWGPYLLSLGLVDQRGYENIMNNAKLVKNAIADENWSSATNLWSRTENIIMDETNGVDFYNVMTKISVNYRRKIALPGAKTDYSLDYIMNNLVRDSLGDFPEDLYWSSSNSAVFQALWNDFMKPVTNIVEQLLNSTDIKVYVFTGQLDLIVDTPGTVNWVENLEWKNKSNWLKAYRDPLIANGIIEGFVKKYNKFGLYWVNRAGHMVPSDNPDGMLEVLKQLTDNFAGK